MARRVWLAALVITILGLTLWVAAQVPEQAVDPVCGMSVAKNAAKWTYEYKDTTYYFCSEGCKTKFSKEPEKYLAKKAEAKPMGGGTGMMGGGMGMMGGTNGQGKSMMGGMDGHGKGVMHGHMEAGVHGGMACPMMMDGVDRQIANTKDGVIITLTSKNPEMVKKLQEHVATMKDAMSATNKKGASEGMCAECPMKKK